MDFRWTEGSILYEITDYTPPKDICKAVCAELGRYYKEKAFKFKKSISELSIQEDDILLEIGLRSSSYNKAGEYVCLEIIPTYYYIPYTRADIKGGGILFDHSDIISEYDKNKEDNKCVLVGIYGDTTIFTNGAYPNEKVRYSHMCDVYNITIDKFIKIINYINTRIVPWVSKIQTETGVEEMISLQRAKRPDWNLQNSNDYVNCSFAYYICDRFPELAKKWDIDTLGTPLK